MEKRDLDWIGAMRRPLDALAKRATEDKAAGRNMMEWNGKAEGALWFHEQILREMNIKDGHFPDGS